EVKNFVESRSEDNYKKLIKASQLIDATDPEYFALLLTLVRKSIQSAADHFFPPVTTGLYRCTDVKERDLSSEKYLNRLEEFLSTNFSKSTSTELLESELKNLTVFLRRLNDISSKGVHSKVDIGEAKQGLLGLYLFLYNVISRLQAD
ncbi:hypothetical protein, partial [Leptospira bandrabouensis]|uniref:hypothetical protein n=1 Tax=Leptospira bandrabouensis TaxID=2484903 RepID=UPI001EE85248